MEAIKEDELDELFGYKPDRYNAFREKGKLPTATQLKIMEVYLRTGSQKMVAEELGISPQTVKNHLGSLYTRLGTDNAIGALNILGWVRVPVTHGMPPCGWIAYCGRHEGHSGQHGGFRPFIRMDKEKKGA